MRKVNRNNRKSVPRGWRGQDFQFGDRSKILGAGADNLPGSTPGEDHMGRPRPLDFERFDSVDWTLNDQAEEYS